jgi:ABC-type glycerol-3-phosphate transport system substrate-binding protein
MQITQVRTRGSRAAMAGAAMAGVLLAAGCSNGSSSGANSPTTSAAAATTTAAATSAAAPTSAAVATSAPAPTSAPTSGASVAPSGTAPAPTGAPAPLPSNSGTLPSSVGFKTAKQTGGGITVWVDATRVPAVKAFEKANPSIKVTMVTYDGAANGTNSFQTKMNLFDKAGNGWPDVVWSTQNNDASWASQKDGSEQAFAAPLDQGLLNPAILSGFTEHALDPCTVSGHVYCLRNDLAPNVLWYNSTLLKQFGYSVPTTWEQYQALGDKVATEHPGYIIGAVGDDWAGPEVYMWGSQCEANNITGPRAVTVNTSTPQCTRAASMLDDLIGNKSVTQDSVFAANFLKSFKGKVLMMPGPAWYGGAIFDTKTGLNVPAGQIGVAPPMTWSGSSPATGDVGGGTWFVSSHSKDLLDARTFATWVTTAAGYQAALAPGLPASATAQTEWIAGQEKSGYYVTPLSVLTDAAKQVWSGWGSGQFSQEGIWAKTMTPQIAAGKKVASLLGTWATAIKNQAQVDGYTVSSK